MIIHETGSGAAINWAVTNPPDAAQRLINEINGYGGIQYQLSQDIILSPNAVTPAGMDQAFNDFQTKRNAVLSGANNVLQLLIGMKNAGQYSTGYINNAQAFVDQYNTVTMPVLRALKTQLTSGPVPSTAAPTSQGSAIQQVPDHGVPVQAAIPTGSQAAMPAQSNTPAILAAAAAAAFYFILNG